jgi:formin-binding protein 1
LYDYQSQGPDELDVSEGARIELTSGPSGGRNYAEGWWEGELQRVPIPSYSILISIFSGIDALGRKGIFPSNYVSAHFLVIGLDG